MSRLSHRATALRGIMPDARNEAKMRQLYCAGLLLLGIAPAAHAQRLETGIAPVDHTPAVIRPMALPRPAGPPHAVRWWEAASVAGFTAAVMTQDEHTTEEFVEHPTDGARHVASVFRRMGQPEVYA